MHNLRATVAGAILLLAAGAIPVIEPHRWLAHELPPLHLESDIPEHFGEWRVDKSISPVLASPDVQAQLDTVYSQLLTRTYVNASGSRIMLVIAYGEDQLGKASVAHLPDSCYPAQGFTISKRPLLPLLVGSEPFNVTRLVAEKSVRVEPITYWTVVGNTSFSSDMDRRFTRLNSALSGIIPDGMLVRVSSIDTTESHAFAVQGQFIQDLYAALVSSVRLRVFGARA